jgi:hypothetical protein
MKQPHIKRFVLGESIYHVLGWHRAKKTVDRTKIAVRRTITCTNRPYSTNTDEGVMEYPLIRPHTFYKEL